MRLLVLLPAALLVCAAPAPARAGVLVELFTSQGCSSCPPADAALARMATDPQLVAISRPVTYWDRLGWRDTLARAENTDLQRRYAMRLPGGVYTPEAVVQGQAGLVGSREPDVRRLAQSIRPAAAIAVRRGPDGALVMISGRAVRPAEVVLLALSASVPVRIGSGENGGRLIRYANVVRSERAIARWTGGALRIAVPVSALRVAGADRYALIIREPAGGPVLGATYL